MHRQEQGTVESLVHSKCSAPEKREWRALRGMENSMTCDKGQQGRRQTQVGRRMGGAQVGSREGKGEKQDA
eukprot:12283518-Alexandrium_andersonii.AAC.1